MKSRIIRLSYLIKCLKKDYFDRIDYEFIILLLKQNNKNFTYFNSYIFDTAQYCYDFFDICDTYNNYSYKW